MNTTHAPRLNDQEVATFRREGYLLPQQQVLPAEKFQGLKTYFETMLDELPPEVRPESMDVPHFTHPELFRWLFADEVLDLVEPIIGPDIALFSSHFICKPKGNGKRVPWHEDSHYWRHMISPMEVVTIWLAIDPSTKENGCMWIIPRTHDNGFSDYDKVDLEKNVFPTEIKASQRDTSKAVPCELQANEASLHDGRIMHGSEANTSALRRCGYTMRYMSTRVRFNHETSIHHQVYLARGRDHAGNVYADPTKSYENLARYRVKHGKTGH
jgi:ectoine hydroxylase-related dioxygenase (phytanoyl-CoA dioxygenase family)